MTMVGDGPDRNREGWVRTGLTLVVAGFDEMEDMVVGPVAGADQDTALGVPDEAPGVAGPLAKQLKLVRPGMEPPQGTGELENLALGNHPAVIEDAVESVQPAVR